MPVTGSKHKIKAYTVEASGTPLATIMAKDISEAIRFVLDDDYLEGNGWLDYDEPITFRHATWLEKDTLNEEMVKTNTDVNGHFVYLHTRESTSEDLAYEARAAKAA